MIDAARILVESMLLGAFVLSGGLYAVFRSLGVLQHERPLLTAGYVSYAVQVAILIAVLVWTPLLPIWKALIAGSCVLYFFIPPITLRYLTRLHEMTDSR